MEYTRHNRFRLGLISLLMLWLTSITQAAEFKIEQWTTKKGTKVLYSYAPELPMVDIDVVFDAGSSRDGEHWGLANLTGSLMGTATAKLSEKEIAAGFNQLGAQFGVGVSRDMTTLSLRSLTRPEIFESAWTLFQQVITQAQFQEAILKRDQARLILGLEEQALRPQSLASKTLWQQLYGDHPYAHPVSGTIETVKTLTIAQLQQFYQRFYIANNAQIALVGNVSRLQAEALAEALSQALPSGQKPALLPAPKPLTQAKRVQMPFDASQSQYYLAQLGVARGEEDYYALFLGNHLFGGGGFGSRLMQEVREKRGLVYSVYSYFAPMKVTGPFMIGLSTQLAKAEQADQVVRQTLVEFLQGFDLEAFEAAKQNLIGGFPLRFANNGKKLSYLTVIGFYDLPLDYLTQFPLKMAALTQSQVLDAWQRHIQPDKLLQVQVGLADQADSD